MEMSLSVLSIIISPLERLANSVRRYQEAKKIKERLFGALGNEIEDIERIFEKIIDLSKVRLLPLLETEKDGLGVTQINKVAQCLADFYILYAELWDSFIRVVNGCYEITSNTAFMEHLHETSDLLHDFVINLGEMRVSSDRIMIDRRYFRFIMLYQDEIFKDFKSGDVDKAIEEMKRYIDIIKNKIKPSFSKKTIRRDTWKNLKKGLIRLAQTGRKVKIEKNLSKDLRKYVPSKFLSLVVLIEDSKILKPVKEHENHRSFVHSRK